MFEHDLNLITVEYSVSHLTIERGRRNLEKLCHLGLRDSLLCHASAKHVGINQVGVPPFKLSLSILSLPLSRRHVNTFFKKIFLILKQKALGG